MKPGWKGWHFAHRVIAIEASGECLLYAIELIERQASGDGGGERSAPLVSQC
jgi:hypothetical protein